MRVRVKIRMRRRAEAEIEIEVEFAFEIVTESADHPHSPSLVSRVLLQLLQAREELSHEPNPVLLN